jgi:crotonobetaine/carnitine-CoA ligase
MLWTQPPTAEDKAHRIRAFVAVPVPAFAREWEERFATRIVSSYGQTDYANVAVYTLLDPLSKLGSAGRPRAGIALRIVDEDDLDVPVGEPGELLVRSSNPWATSQGYYKMPEATVAATRNLWWHTGDSASIDADGYLWFAGRKKDALRRRGENISAYEVETLLMEHPAVAEAAVFAVRSEMAEDEVAATVVRAPGQLLTEEALIAYCVRHMAHYMVPRYIQFAAALPRTESQKVRKAELRQAAEADVSRLWDREKAGIVVRRE